MATPSVRPQKHPKKPNDAGPRRPAWGNRPFSPAANNNNRLPPSSPAPSAPPAPAAFPPLPPPTASAPSTLPRPHDKTLQALTGLTGTTITLATKSGQRYEGVVASTAAEGDTSGVTLRDVRDIAVPGAPIKDALFVAATNFDSWASGPADARAPNTAPNGDAFKTDTDISQKAAPRRERDLQAWADDVPPGMSTPTFGPPSSATHHPSSAAPSTAAPTAGPAPSFAAAAAAQGAQGRGGHHDDITFGAGATGAHAQGWDQFAANEQLFGVRTQFDEDAYTTRIDRTRADYKERERRAAALASEISSSATNNPHIAEERVMNNVDGAGADEEDRYGAVVRSSNAYVPPGARKLAPGPAPNGPAAAAATKAVAPDLPRVAVNAPDGSALSPRVQTPASSGSGSGSGSAAAGTSKAPSPAPTAANSKPAADPLPAFRDFVTNEKQRLTQKRQALVKNERDKRMAELLRFSQSFKLNKPIPDDLVSILAKDEDKQRQIREKSSRDAASAQARAIGVTSATAALLGPGPGPAGAPHAPAVPASATVKALASAKHAAGAGVGVGASASAGSALGKAGDGATGKAAQQAAPGKSGRISMVIQPIPPFKGPRAGKHGAAGDKAGAGAGAGSAAGSAAAAGVKSAGASASASAQAQAQAQAQAHANRLNANASSFRPNPKAVAFMPSSPNAVSPSTAATASPKGKSDSAANAPATPNPFFGARPLKKQPVHVKDDFNPFKYNKVADASAINSMWPYQGKRYSQMFMPVQMPPQQHSPHMPPPGPVAPMPPPPSYEEDSAAQAAARGYVYAYPPYGYPGQPMMPGMVPPPPGAYMQGPFMQPMHYPPSMPPNAMYASPQMGQMPPPQAYMHPPPPPGSYGPPPNGGGGPRPSMPPTPIPAPAHPYYHQSPQLQHAVPYPMMMPPPPPGPGQQGLPPPHGYDAGPQQQMGGVGHA